MIKPLAWALAALCMLGLAAAGSATAAPRQKASQTFAVFQVSPGARVQGKQSLQAAAEGREPEAKTSRPDAQLLGLAREGHIQNLRAMGDGSYRMLADEQAALTLRAGGSSLTLLAAGSPAQPSLILPGLVSGVVTAASGGGIAGATVTAFSTGTVFTATTAPNGSYSLSLPGNGDYQVGVFANGYEWQPGVMVALPNGANDVNFSLVPQNLTIRGRITNQSNNPLPNVEVSAYDLVVDNFTAGDNVLTDVAGQYTLTVSASTYEVRAFATPVGVKSMTVIVPPSAVGKDFTFNVPTLYTIKGTALRANGQPLSGAEITIFTDHTPFASCDPPYVNAGVTDSAGNYALSLPAGTYSLYANWPEEFPDHWRIATGYPINVTGDMRGINVTLPAVGTIRGTVRAPNGQPLSDASIFSWRSSPAGGPDGLFHTDAAGTFVITATLGKHDLVAFSNSYPNSDPREVDLEGSVGGVNFQLNTQGRKMGGVLTGYDGKPLRWATLQYEVGPAYFRFNHSGTVYYNGRWQAPMLYGSTNIYAGQPYYVEKEQAVNVAPNSPGVNFTELRKFMRVSGRITTPPGVGLCDTYMTASDAATGIQQAYGNSTGDGDYAMAVAPGMYNVFPYKHDSNSSLFNSLVVLPPAPGPINFLVTPNGR